MGNEINSISGITDVEEIKKKAEEPLQRTLEGFEYKVFGEESLEEIIELAVEDWESDSGCTQPSEDRLAVDFLRHRRTAYDWQLGEIQNSLFELEPIDEDGENPLEAFFDGLRNDAHAIIRAKTLDAIRAKHPELAGAVAQRRDSNYVVSGGQRFRVGRPSYLPR